MGGKAVGHWADRVAEIGGGLSLGAGAGVSAWLAHPVAAKFQLIVVIAAIGVGFALGWTLVRRVGPSCVGNGLPAFAVESIPLALPMADEADELLLDDPVTVPGIPSRVVSLFGADPVPTAGELQRRIEQHLASPGESSSRPLHQVPDASDALFEALADLRRSLRRA